MLIQDPPVQILDRLWMLGTTGYPIYLYRGRQGDTMFEGGIGPVAAVLRQQLQDLDVPADRVRRLIVTHAHPDHVMAVPAMKDTCPNLEVLASPIAARTLAAEKAVSFFAKMDDALTGSLIGLGLATEEQRRAPLSENRIAVDREVKEGDTIEVDEGLAFQVIETPGHSDCSLSFYEPQAKVLIISDATGYYMPDHEDWWPNYFIDYGKYLRSIERLSEIGAEVLCLSHNGAIRGADDVVAYFNRAIAATKAYHERIVGQVRSGKTVREVAEALGQEIHDKSPLMPLEFFQKNCSILVKASLAHEGIEVEK